MISYVNGRSLLDLLFFSLHISLFSFSAIIMIGFEGCFSAACGGGDGGGVSVFADLVVLLCLLIYF